MHRESQKPVFPEQYTQARRVSQGSLEGLRAAVGVEDAHPSVLHNSLEGGDSCTVAWQPLPSVLALCFQGWFSACSGYSIILRTRVSGLCQL